MCEEPYPRAILNIIGLYDPTFFSIQGTGPNPDAVAGNRIKADEALKAYFSSFGP
jgi:hypothetical protein